MNGVLLSKFIIKLNGKTVVRTLLPETAEKYRRRPGYRVLTIPVTR